MVRPRETPLPFNIAPSLFIETVVKNGDERHCGPMGWGFESPRLAARPQINARGETVATNGLFREAFLRRRCLVVVDAFYEWQRDGKVKRPFAIRLRLPAAVRSGRDLDRTAGHPPEAGWRSPRLRRGRSKNFLKFLGAPELTAVARFQSIPQPERRLERQLSDDCGASMQRAEVRTGREHGPIEELRKFLLRPFNLVRSAATMMTALRARGTDGAGGSLHATIATAHASAAAVVSGLRRIVGIHSWASLAFLCDISFIHYSLPVPWPFLDVC